MNKVYCDEYFVRDAIQNCQSWNHIQQAVFSSYYNALTQVCFTCDAVRTSLKKEDLK